MPESLQTHELWLAAIGGRLPRHGADGRVGRESDPFTKMTDMWALEESNPTTVKADIMHKANVDCFCAWLQVGSHRIFFSIGFLDEYADKSQGQVCADPEARRGRAQGVGQTPGEEVHAKVGTSSRLRLELILVAGVPVSSCLALRHLASYGGFGLELTSHLPLHGSVGVRSR